MRAAKRPRVPKEMVERINQVEARHKGKIVAIEPESGDYFIADTTIEAVRKAKSEYPDRVFVCKRIGFPWTHRHAGVLKRVVR